MKHSYIASFIILIGSMSFDSTANTINHIVDTQELELCAHPRLMPLSHRDENSNGALGFQIDLARALASQLNVAMNVSWVISKRHVKKTDCDFYAGVAIIAGSDSKYIKISDAYYRMKFVVVTLKGSPPIVSTKQLDKLTVGVSSGSVASFALRKNNIATAIRFQDENARLHALVAGKVDAVVVSSLTANWFAQKNSIELRLNNAEMILGVSLNYDYALGLRRADSETINVFNNLLRGLKNDGTLISLFEAYGMTNIASAK